MALYKHRILYEKGVVGKLAKRYSVSVQTIRAALRFATEGELPDLIRQTCIKEYGGVVSRRPIDTKAVVVTRLK